MMVRGRVVEAEVLALKMAEESERRAKEAEQEMQRIKATAIRTEEESA